MALYGSERSDSSLFIAIDHDTRMSTKIITFQTTSDEMDHTYLEPLIYPHHCIITEIIEQWNDKPLECLTSIFLPTSLSSINRVCNGQGIHYKEDIMNSVEDFIWNCMTVECCTRHEQLRMKELMFMMSTFIYMRYIRSKSVTIQLTNSAIMQ